MSHVTGTVQTVAPVLGIGPDSGNPASSPNTWTHSFAHTAAPGGTRLLMLHFQNVSLPANNRLEVDLGYDTDVFHAADGSAFWTRPINVAAFANGLVPIRYITDGANTGGVQIDRYGRGEAHAGDQQPSSSSNCDPFLLTPNPNYPEPNYDTTYLCHNPPIWENSACAPAGDIRAAVARSVGMIVSVEESHWSHTDVISTCTVTLIGPDLVISAGHCHSAADALTSSVTFDYATNCDGTKPNPYNPRFHKVVRAVKLRWLDPAHPGQDFSLLQIKLPPGGLGIAPIPLRHDLPALNEQVFGVSHPNGAVKKLHPTHGAGFTTVSQVSSSAIVAAQMDVSGGSSGSGLFDSAGNYLGVLSNGAGCNNLHWFPIATIIPALAEPETSPISRDVMIVFDRSGSMSMDAGTGHTKMWEAHEAASLFVELVRVGGGNKAGLVSFSSAASVPADHPLANVNPPAKAALQALIGALAPGGSTTIGGGLEAARQQFPNPGSNPRAILLLTDGLQNTPPWIDQVSGALNGIDLHAIGFGTESSLDGALLSHLAQAHNGLYTRAGSPLDLKKFFALAFGNIFESGTLVDPPDVLKAGQPASDPLEFRVCDEDTITVVVGWESESTPLDLRVSTPSGSAVVAGSGGVEEASGRTWRFLRIPLPQGGEREGTWKVQVARESQRDHEPGREPEVRYFITVIAAGGPRLWPVTRQRRWYSGDPINPLVGLRYADGDIPHHAKIQVTVTKPADALGNVLAGAKLRPPETLDGDTIPALQATLRALEQQSGQPAIGHTEEVIDLRSDSASTDWALEPHGLFGCPLDDLLGAEGDYRFHFRATYGEDCVATRELVWSVHVEPGVDPERSDVTTDFGGRRPDGRRSVTITVTPRDRYGNLLGPGRAGAVTISGAPGTEITGAVHDNGDGSYTVDGAWDDSGGGTPAVVLTQPERPPVVVYPSDGAGGGLSCRWWQLLCLLLALLAIVLLVLVLS